MYIFLFKIRLKFFNYKKSVVRFADHCPQQLKIVLTIKIVKSNLILNLM